MLYTVLISLIHAACRDLIILPSLIFCDVCAQNTNYEAPHYVSQVFKHPLCNQIL
jgi:hypothetical protein